MSGMNRVTGKVLEGIEHLRQSIADILGTALGSRVMRRPYGSLWLELIDQPDNGATRVRLYAATAGALMQWEPRLRLSRVQIFGTDVPGQVVLDLQGIYSPPGQRRSVLSMRVPVQVGAAA
jgi:phage baseplate assembly protein W